jgi:hypothetical protein
MQITHADIIKNGEQDLIDSITADLDWGAIENIFREQHNLGIDEDVEYKKGDIIVHQNQIAYQLQFEVKVTVSVLLDREGNYLSVSFSGNKPDPGAAERNEDAEDQPEDTPESSGNQAKTGGLVKKANTPGEDIEELEALAENETYDGSEILETEAIEDPPANHEKKEAQQTIHEPVAGEKGFKENLSKDNADQKISRIASQVGEMMEELGEEISA